MAINQNTQGLVTGSATTENGIRDQIVWWHNNTSPFYIRVIFDEECNYVTFEAVKQKLAIGPTDEYANGVDRGSGAYGMAFYIVVGANGRKDTSLVGVSQETLWGRDVGISQSGSGNYHYDFANDPRCILYIPHQAGRESFRYSTTVPVSSLGITDDQSKLYIYGACESASTYASSSQCYNFQNVDGAFGVIMDIDIDFEYPPSNLVVTQKASGTTLYPVFTWKQSSYSKHGNYDILHYKFDDDGEWQEVKGNGSGTTLLFTGLEPGTAHRIYYYITRADDKTHYCSNETNGINMMTYRIRPTYSKLINAVGVDADGYAISSDLTSATFELQYQKDNDMIDKVISYRLYTEDLKTIPGHEILRCNDDNLCTEETSYTVTINDLEPGKRYQLRVWLKDTNNESGITPNAGSPDTIYHIPFSTSDPFEFGDHEVNATGTTLTISQYIDPHNSTFENKGTGVTIKLYNGSKLITTANEEAPSKADYVTHMFTGLDKGVTYRIVVSCIDDYNYSDSIEYSGITYKLNLKLAEYSTKAIKFSATISVKGSGHNNPAIYYSVDDSNNETQCSGDTIADNLTHNTIHTITAWIYDSTGNMTKIDDTEESIAVKTRELIIKNTGYYSKQHSIISTWQASASGIDIYDIENVTESKISFVLSKSTYGGYKKDTDDFEFKTPDTDKMSGTSIGDYQIDKTLISDNLDYWSWYTIECCIGDGYNTVVDSIEAHTDFPYMYIYSKEDNKYHRIIPYVFDDNKWKLAPAFIFDGARYRECNGE